MGKTEISWADETWNPVRGCSRVSEGCRHCYAETTAARFSGPGQPYEGLVKVVTKEKVLRRDFADGSVGLRKHETREARWTGDVRFIASALAEPLRRKKPTRYFVNSMSDLFHDGFTNEQIAAVFGVMAACPQHTFMVLTKRAKRMREWFEWVANHVEGDAEEMAGRECSVSIHDARQACILEYLDETATSTLAGHLDACHLGITTSGRIEWPPPNVWLGVSVENRDAAIERLDYLRACPAAVRFISAEPLLEDPGAVDLTGISWVIAGCESGHGARPCEVAWLRSLRDQCAEAGLTFFLKQAREEREICEKGCGEPVQQDIVHERAAIYSCGCAIEEWKTSPPRGIAYSDGSKRKPGGIIELPYLDGVKHDAFPAAK